MNAAQKVRLWFMLGISIIQAICIVYLGVIPGYQLVLGGGDTAYAWILITFIANVTLGSVSLYRFMHRLPPKPVAPAGYVPGYYPAPPQGYAAAPQYAPTQPQPPRVS